MAHVRSKNKNKEREVIPTLKPPTAYSVKDYCPQTWTFNFIAIYCEHSQQEKFYHMINVFKLFN